MLTVVSSPRTQKPKRLRHHTHFMTLSFVPDAEHGLTNCVTFMPPMCDTQYLGVELLSLKQSDTVRG